MQFFKDDSGKRELSTHGEQTEDEATQTNVFLDKIKKDVMLKESLTIEVRDIIWLVYLNFGASCYKLPFHKYCNRQLLY